MIQFATPASQGSPAATTVPDSAPVAPSPETVKARRQRLAGLGDEIARVSAHIEAARGHLLDLIRAFDEEQGWHEEGFRNCAAWLSWRTGIGAGAARERVRVARALGELPELRAALAAGELSYSVARAITRVATPENEAGMVETARHTTAAEMERLVGAWGAADRAEEGTHRTQRRRTLRLAPSPHGPWRVDGWMVEDGGAVLDRALEAAMEILRARAGAESEAADPVGALRADALALVAEAALGGGLAALSEKAPAVSRADRFQVVVHVSAETLAAKCDAAAQAAERAAPGAAGTAGVGDNTPPERGGATGGSAPARGAGPPDAARIEGGPYVSAETSRRLACDAGVVEMTHDGQGGVLDVGRRRRTVPTALRRALERRDGGCRFPGCRSRFCDAHHLTHWADGGETALGNLVLLCRHHHRRVHEDGWRVELGQEGEPRFHRPDGWELTPLPERLPVARDPVRELERRHDRLGLDIDPWTPTPDWTGERLDVDWALFTLRQPALPT